MNKFDEYMEEKRSKMKEFHDKLNETLDKKAIAETFEMGLEVGFFGKFKKTLFLQFQEGGYDFTLIRKSIDVGAIIRDMGLVKSINLVSQRKSIQPFNKFNRRRFA